MNQDVANALKSPLMRLGATYLLKERDNGRALDRVANFHLSNGARVERVNWLADISTKGLEQSAGLMVNYLYELGDIEGNHESYRASGNAKASPEMLALLELSESDDKPE